MESPRQGNRLFTVVKNRIHQDLKLFVKYRNFNFHLTFRLKNKITFLKVVGSTARPTLESDQIRKSLVP